MLKIKTQNKLKQKFSGHNLLFLDEPGEEILVNFLISSVSIDTPVQVPVLDCLVISIEDEQLVHDLPGLLLQG